MITKWCNDCGAYAEYTCEDKCNDYFCEECAKKRDYICPECGRKLKKFENM